MQMVRGNGGINLDSMLEKNVRNLNGNQNGLIVVPRIANLNVNQIGNGNVVAARAKVMVIGTMEIKYGVTTIEDWVILLGTLQQAKKKGYLDEIKEVNAKCILMANLQQASTSGTQIDKAPVYDSDGSAENDSDVISMVSSVEQGGGILKQNQATVEETCALYDSLYNNLAIEVEKVNTVNRKMKETNAELTIELARYKN
uniref:Uncharacterized protein n=1 Tax=Tanacetum cinerariifolium TaxID=118510 RepID=A0A699JH90_TANCI|nr:hypothetical protein [Tanacetum cinerariifolium]